jgi:hypothetical protein
MVIAMTEPRNWARFVERYAMLYTIRRRITQTTADWPLGFVDVLMLAHNKPHEQI